MHLQFKRHQHARNPTPISKVPAAETLSSELQSRVEKAKKCLIAARDRLLHRDRNSKEIDYNVGDMVLLSTKNITFKGPNSKKLLPRWIGPYPIIKRIGHVAYKLKLPDNMKIHPVFHCKLLKKFMPSTRHQPPPPPLLIDNQLEFEVELIHAHKINRRNKRFFLVRWAGYGPEHDTWEPEVNLKNCPDILHDYCVSKGIN